MSLSPAELLATIDHAILKPDCTYSDVMCACRMGRAYRLASVCVPPIWASMAVQELSGAETPVSSVVGFPYGFVTSETKAAEAAALVAQGCAELDMVMNISALCSGRLDMVISDIAAVAQSMEACAEGPHLKVILETCYLDEQQIAQAVDAAVQAGAQYVKTSTGFGPHGATVEHVALLRRLAPPHIGVKAAGGIRSLAELQGFIAAGADRIGTSATEAIIEQLQAGSGHGHL